jgi:hypothetical protein
VRQGNGISHEGRITTDAPDLVWGTDGTRVLTAEEGMCFRLHGRRPLQLRGRRPPRTASAVIASRRCSRFRRDCSRSSAA